LPVIHPSYKYRSFLHDESLEPQVVEAIVPVLEDQHAGEGGLSKCRFRSGARTLISGHCNIRLLQSGARIVNGDLRKFCEQMGDILEWDQVNKSNILTHASQERTGDSISIRFPFRSTMFI